MSLTLDPAIPSTARASSVAARTLTAGGLFAIAAVHLMDLPGKEPSYLAVLYVGLVLVCVGVATRLVMRPAPTTWLAAVAIPLATMAAYAVTRTRVLRATSATGPSHSALPRSRAKRQQPGASFSVSWRCVAARGVICVRCPGDRIRDPR